MEVISFYSRDNAIEDGVLIDVTEISKEAGFKVPVAVTSPKKIKKKWNK